MAVPPKAVCGRRGRGIVADREPQIHRAGVHLAAIIGLWVSGVWGVKVACGETAEPHDLGREIPDDRLVAVDVEG
ncbi:MAG: hypothetical protein ACO3QA_07530, partial [Phycisphaerales bacterium]